MKRKKLSLTPILLSFIFILSGCDRGSEKLTKAEIKKLCADVGSKAFAQANDGKKEFRALKWIEDGAIAECELKYLSNK